MNKSNNSLFLLSLTADIIASYVSNNDVTIDSLPKLIQNTHASLSATGGEQSNLAADRPKPAVPIKKSVTDEYIICLEDGKKK